MIGLLLVASLSLPAGTVIATAGHCPTKWVEADGKNGRLDLRGKICGSDGMCIFTRHCIKARK